jgi:dihydrofolate synthase/folylpolyglutamate synthase
MIERKQQSHPQGVQFPKQRSYHEVVEYLDAHWNIDFNNQSLHRAQELNKALGNVSEKIDTILVSGTNGKSITTHLATKLFKEEGLKAGAFFSPHILTYNERFSVGQEIISNKVFTDVANEVINTAEQCNIDAHTSELLVMIALKHFINTGADVALLEVSSGTSYDPALICNARVATVTRVTAPDAHTQENDLFEHIKDMMHVVKPGTHIVSGDQSKAHLQMMQEITQSIGGHWAMPIRKLAPLSYPYEQLHGRCAALAERVAQLYMEHFVVKHATVVTDSLLTKPKGQRGRPTLEAKRQSELNPKKTIEQFWKETTNELPSRFHILDKEKPSILLDTAHNIDAFKNLLLGIRLLHYQRPIKGLTLVIGAEKDSLCNEEFLKLMRYFFKKTSGQLFVCPIDSHLAGSGENVSWDAEKVTNDVKSMKVKARAFNSFKEACDVAKKSVDERDGLVVITGSRSIVNNYWRLQGIKKF